MTTTTTYDSRQLLRMFIDETPNEVYFNGRLATVEANTGEVLLVAYGSQVIASADGNNIRLYTGHYDSVSQTVNDYIERLGEVLNESEGRTVDVRDDSAPTMGIGSQVSEAAQFINNYVNWNTTLSPVEEDAQNTVEEALNERMEELF